MIMKISELRMKDVIEAEDGRRLGYIHDLELDPREGRIKALLIPGSRNWHRLFSQPDETSLPWEQIRKLGVDVILVQKSVLRAADSGCSPAGATVTTEKEFSSTKAVPSEEATERHSWDEDYSFFDL